MLREVLGETEKGQIEVEMTELRTLTYRHYAETLDPTDCAKKPLPTGFCPDSSSARFGVVREHEVITDEFDLRPFRKGSETAVYTSLDGLVTIPGGHVVLIPHKRDPQVFLEDMAYQSSLAIALEPRGKGGYVPSVHAVGKARDGSHLPYAVVEQVDGEDLWGIISQEPLSLEASLTVNSDLLSIFERAPKFRHGDISPRNVMIDSTGRVALIDIHRRPKYNLVTPGFGRRERVVNILDRRAGDILPEDDQFSIAALTYACVTGHSPFSRHFDFTLIYANATQDNIVPIDTQDLEINPHDPCYQLLIQQIIPILREGIEGKTIPSNPCILSEDHPYIMQGRAELQQRLSKYSSTS